MKVLESLLHIRWCIRRDLPELLAIEETLPRPITEEQILAHIRQRNCICMVIEYRDKVVGQVTYELHADHIVLTRLTVSPAFRRQGVGRALMAKLLSKLTSSHRRAYATVLVPERDMGTLLFFKATGWIATEVHRGADEATGEDLIEFIGRPTAEEDNHEAPT